MRYNTITSVSRLFPRSSIKFSTDFTKREKVKRLCRFFHVCTMDDDGSGNKRLTEKNRQKQTTLSSNGLIRFIQISIKIKERHYYETWGTGGKQETALPPEKIILLYGTTPVALSLCFIAFLYSSVFGMFLNSEIRLNLPSAFVCLCFYSRYFRLTDLMNARMAD